MTVERKDVVLVGEVKARRYARAKAKLHGEVWCVFEVQEEPGENLGGQRFHACKASEAADYEAGGARIVSREG